MLFSALFLTPIQAQKVNICIKPDAGVREQYAAEYLRSKLACVGLEPYIATHGKNKRAKYSILLSVSNTGPKEGFSIKHIKHNISVIGNDETGVIYGCNEIARRVKTIKDLDTLSDCKDKPEMVLRDRKSVV